MKATIFDHGFCFKCLHCGFTYGATHYEWTPKGLEKKPTNINLESMDCPECEETGEKKYKIEHMNLDLSKLMKSKEDLWIEIRKVT